MPLPAPVTKIRWPRRTKEEVIVVVATMRMIEVAFRKGTCIILMATGRMIIGLTIMCLQQHLACWIGSKKKNASRELDRQRRHFVRLADTYGFIHRSSKYPENPA